MKRWIKSSAKKREDCPICGSKKIKDYMKNKSKKAGHRFLIESSFCDSCGFYFQNPIMDYDKVKEIYTKKYVGDEFEQNERFEREIINRKSSALSFIDLIKEGDSILEVGCSSGYNLLNIKNNFKGEISLKGIDFDQASVNFGRKRTGIDLSTNDASSLTEKYDFVLLNHVFEHVENPREFLKLLLGLVKKSGYLVINVPNSEKWLEVPYWEHINYFNEKAMTLLLLNFIKETHFSISTNTIHKVRHNVPEIRVICSVGKTVEQRESEKYVFDFQTIRDRYDISPKSERATLRKIYREITLKSKPPFLKRLIWSKFYVFFKIQS